MAANQLALTNVVTIQVAAAQAGVGQYNTSNLALFTSEVYNPSSFGTDGFKIYLSPTEVGEDFGTDSVTYAQAVAVFSQKPNILAGNGYLVIIPFLEAKQSFSLSAVPASGSFTLAYTEGTSAAINWDDSASAIQVKIRAISSDFANAVVSGSLASETLAIDFKGTHGAVALPTVGGAGLQTISSASITITPSAVQVGEALGAAIARTEGLVQYFGLMCSLVLGQTELLAAAATIQPLNKIGFFVQNDAATVEAGGIIDLLTTGSFSQSRGLFYGDSDDSAALGMQAAYAGRALSVNFAGSLTTITMHLKDLISVQPDPIMTQTLLNKCQSAGADVYVSLQGVPKIFCSGANSFYDQVYNLQWLTGALQVAGFNYLAQSATKVPQTESGMDGLKSAYRQVCDLAVVNGYSAPGQWNSSTTFGNQADFYANIAQVGYYIYSQPIAKQLQAAREDRQAPLVQIALKEAGAIHSSTVIVYINA